MRARIIMLMSLLVMLTSTSGIGKSKKKPDSDRLVARLAYKKISVIRSSQERSSRVCFALYRSGHYQVLRDTETGTEFLHGELSPYQLQRVSRMLKGLDFQTSGASVIRQGSESFEAEVHSSGKAKRYLWVNPDHLRPFPKSAIDIVYWLRNFKAQGASPLPLGEFSEQQSCPSETSLLPVTGDLQHGVGASSRGSLPR